MPSETISHYRILSKLGAGGMGEVYLAEDATLDRKVAVKFLSADSDADEQAKKRLIREARTAAKLDHPNICSVYEVGEEDGRAFVVMQYIEGETLANRFRREATDLSESFDIAAQTADALAEAHSHGIIHRDIKPANIMITGRGQVKVMDFGLARLIQDEASPETQAATKSLLTEPGTVIGTVPYMSPEQVEGKALDARSDIFSFGSVLYEMLTGRQPFAAETAAATASAILTREPLPLTRFAPAVPSEMQRIVRKCLEKDRESRYQSARELLIDLRNLKRESESGSIISEKTGSHTRKLHPLAYGALALLVLASAAISLYVLIGGAKPIDSIAVLPFINTNGDPNTEYLADGIPESISNSLSQLPNLKVMSRNSVFRFKGSEADAKEVGQKLGVRAVLTGRISQRGESLAINIELVDARDNSQIWGHQYNRRLADVFAIQEEMAKEISEKLRLRLSGPEQQQLLAKRPTENLKAFEYYMQARAYAQRRTREDLLEAIRYCDKAIEEDSNYALAYVGLADANSGLAVRGYIVPVEGRRKAEEAARKALALDENLAEAHAVIGQMDGVLAPFNFPLADRELRRAIELSPSLAAAHQYLGLSLARQGRLDESLPELQKARELDPLSSVIARQHALPYYLKRDYVRAVELLRKANELGPALNNMWEIGVYVQSGLINEALTELENSKRERKGDPILIASTGMVYATQGKRAEALQIVKELETMSGGSLSHAQWIAKIYAGLNERELVFSWLERGLAAGAIGTFFKDEPVWEPVRGDPRFTDLLRHMGIPL
jgi:serine/threonine-protein kinase